MSIKIEKLTPEQQAKFPVYVDKWIGVGTNTQRITQENAESIVKDFRELISMKSDVPTFLLENPIECWVACCLVEQKVPLSDLRREMEGVFNGNPKKWVIPQGSLPFNKVSLVSVFSFYDFMFNEVGVQIDSDLMRKYKIWEKTSELWGIYPLENVTIVCQFPTEIKLNENRVLHCDNGPALSFSGLGDFKVYCLNGVEVPEYLAVTPSHKIDLEMYNKETNADVDEDLFNKIWYRPESALWNCIDFNLRDTHPTNLYYVDIPIEEGIIQKVDNYLISLEDSIQSKLDQYNFLKKMWTTTE